MLGAAVVILGAVVGLARFSMDQGLAPFPKSPEFLTESSRELIRSFGYTAEPADEASWWERRYDYLKYRAAHEPSTRWWRSLARTEPHPWWFWHRQSPRFLVPENPFGDPAIRPTDPPLEVSGMVNLALDARGNLMRLRAVPPQVEGPGRVRESARRAGLEAAFRRGGSGLRAFFAVAAALAAERALRHARGLGRRLRLEPERADPRGGRGVARQAGLLRGPRALEPSRAHAGAGAGGRARDQQLRGSRLHPLGLGGRALHGPSEPAAGPRRPARRDSHRDLRLQRGRPLLDLLGSPRAESGRGLDVPELPCGGRVPGRLRLARVHRDRAHRAAEVARAAVFLEPAALRTVSRSPGGPRRARGNPHRSFDDAAARGRVCDSQLG